MALEIIENDIESFVKYAKELYQDNPFYMDDHFYSSPADYHLFTVEDNSKVRGRIACIKNSELKYYGYKLGLISHYECDDSKEVSEMLLSKAEEYLKGYDCDFIIGPLNKSTWHKYRIADKDNISPFFLDCISKPWYEKQFHNSSFKVIGNYYSSKATRLSVEKKRLDKFDSFYKSKGVKIRNFNPNDFKNEIQKIYEISINAFENNFLYSPISYDEMYSMYAGLEKLIDPSLIYICEDENSNGLAFLFASKDIINQNKNVYIIKSAAVVPGRLSMGLGTYLSELIHYKLFNNGADEIIHALMFQSNESRNVLKEESKVISKYYLFGKEI